MNIFVSFLPLIAVIVGFFYITVVMIRLLTGCTFSEAKAKLRVFIKSFMGDNVHYRLEDDVSLVDEIWYNVKSIIGEKRYSQLVSLNASSISPPLLFFDMGKRLPYIIVSLYYTDSNERQILENVIVKIFQSYLRAYHHSATVLTTWRERYDLNMPYLRINYSRNEDELRILNDCIRDYRKTVKNQNSDIIDDTEDDDLNE